MHLIQVGLIFYHVTWSHLFLFKVVEKDVLFFSWELGRHGCNCLMAGAAIPVRSRAVKWRSLWHGREWLSTFPYLVCWWWILGDGKQGNSVQSKGSLRIDTWHYHDVGAKNVMLVWFWLCARRSEWSLNVVSWGLKILMRSRCWSLKVRIATRLFTDWLHLPAWCVFASQMVLYTFFVGHVQFQMQMVEFGNSEERRGPGPGPKFQGEASKNTHAPSPKKMEGPSFHIETSINHLPKYVAHHHLQLLASRPASSGFQSLNPGFKPGNIILFVWKFKLLFFLTFYHGKSPPLNDHFGKYIYIFPTTLIKSKYWRNTFHCRKYKENTSNNPLGWLVAEWMNMLNRQYNITLHVGMQKFLRVPTVGIARGDGYVLLFCGRLAQCWSHRVGCTFQFVYLPWN